MGKKGKKIITKKKLVIIVVIAAIVLFTIINNIINKNKEEVPEFEIEEITRRTIAQSISATGTVTTSNVKNVTGLLTGVEVKSVNVKKGDFVNAGDVIATLDTSTIKQNLGVLNQTANISAAQANIGIQSAQRSLDDAKNNKDNQLATAKTAVDQTQKAHDDAINAARELEKQIKKLEDQLATISNGEETASTNAAAIADLNQQIAQKQSEIDLLKLSISSKQNEISAANLTGDDVSALNSDLATLQSNLSAAQAELVTLQTQLTAAQTSVNNVIATNYTTIKTQLDQLKAQKAAIDKTVPDLKTAYDNAVKAYNSATSTVDSSIAALNDNLANAQLGAAQARLSTKGQSIALNEQLKNGTVKTNVSGTVSAVNVKVGDIYMGTTIAVIDGVDNLIIETEIDEYDIADIDVGMEVLVKTDATRDKELQGVVTYVSQVSTAYTDTTGMMAAAATGKAVYKVEIELNESNERLRLGMNARISIITQKAENALVVPYDAILTREDGSHYIEIAKSDDGLEKEEVDVEVGVEGTYYTEVKSAALTEGMKVIIPVKDSVSSIEKLIEIMGAGAGM